MEFQRGLVRSYDATTHTAAVLLVGSLSRILVAVPVAHHIGPELMTAGAACGVAFFAEGSKAVVLCTFDGAALGTGCRVTRSAGKSIPNTTWTAIDFNVEQWDPQGMHDNVTNNTRLTSQLPGKYVIDAGIGWPVTPGGSWRLLELRLNGTTSLMRERHAATSYSEMGITAVYSLAVANYVELLVYQDSGGALTAQNMWAAVTRTGP